jgi:hypothetical protein
MVAAIRLFLCVTMCVALVAPAHACLAPGTADLSDVRYADLVLIGRVQNYRIVRDEFSRQSMRRVLQDPALPRQSREVPERQLRGDSLLRSDYAKFDILVHRQLSGKSPRILTVALNKPAFEEPRAVPAGLYIIALRSSDSKLPAESRYRDFDLENREPTLPTVLSARCDGPFMFKVTSEAGKTLIARLSQSGHGNENSNAFLWLLMGGIAAANLGLFWLSRVRPVTPPVRS